MRGHSRRWEGADEAGTLKFRPTRMAGVPKIEHVTMDMSAAFIAEVRKRAPQAEIVFDPFHVVKLAGEAVHKLRRDEARARKGSDQADVLKGSRWALLKASENLKPHETAKLSAAPRNGTANAENREIVELLERNVVGDVAALGAGLHRGLVGRLAATATGADERGDDRGQYQEEAQAMRRPLRCCLAVHISPFIQSPGGGWRFERPTPPARTGRCACRRWGATRGWLPGMAPSRLRVTTRFISLAQ